MSGEGIAEPLLDCHPAARIQLDVTLGLAVGFNLDKVAELVIAQLPRKAYGPLPHGAARNVQHALSAATVSASKIKS